MSSIPLLSAVVGSLAGRLALRLASPADVDECQQITRQYPKELGRVFRDSLLRSVETRGLIVALVDGVIRGFVQFARPSRGVNVGYAVIYHIAVARGWCGLDIGRNLVFAVPAPIRLKCVASNGRAVGFYRSLGFEQMFAAQSQSGTPLVVLEKLSLFGWVQGDQRRVPAMARSAGGFYGTRHTEKPYAYPFMLDVNFERYFKRDDVGRMKEWELFLSLVRKYAPVAVMVVDYITPDQRDLMLQQVADLRGLRVPRIMVCPKFCGAVADIPGDCVVAISVPSGYAGFLPDPEELRGRDVHLLGGSPRVLLDLVQRYPAFGARVISIDANAFSKAAGWRRVWAAGRWQRLHFGRHSKVSAANAATPYECMEFSARNFVFSLEASSEWIQERLL